MATIYPVQSGNWGDTSTWNTTSVPTSSDDVTIGGDYAYLVTLNDSYTCHTLAVSQEYSTSSGLSISTGLKLAGYTLTVSNGITAVGTFAVDYGTILANIAGTLGETQSGVSVTGNISGDIHPQSDYCTCDWNITGNVSGTVESDNNSVSWNVAVSGSVGGISVTGSGGSGSSITAGSVTGNVAASAYQLAITIQANVGGTLTQTAAYSSGSTQFTIYGNVLGAVYRTYSGGTYCNSSMSIAGSCASFTDSGSPSTDTVNIGSVAGSCSLTGSHDAPFTQYQIGRCGPVTLGYSESGYSWTLSVGCWSPVTTAYPDCAAGNIKAGKSIGGVTGSLTAGNPNFAF